MKLDQIVSVKEANRHNIYLMLSEPANREKVLSVLSQFGISCLDIGKKLAEDLQKIKIDKFISIASHELVNKVIEENAGLIPGSSVKSLAISNLGILLEPVLGLRPEQILKDISKTVVLILIWEGDMDGNVLHWTSQKESYNLDFSDIDLKIIEIDYEV